MPMPTRKPSRAVGSHVDPGVDVRGQRFAREIRDDDGDDHERSDLEPGVRREKGRDQHGGQREA
jgi:hypothetical protein